MKKKHEALGLLDTVENTTKKRTIELKNHTIEITEMDDQLSSNTGIYMGHNQTANNDPIDIVKSESSFYQKLFSFVFRERTIHHR
jgi:hypothetical protein